MIRALLVVACVCVASADVVAATGARSLSAPQTTARLGLGHGVEARLITDGFDRRTVSGPGNARTTAGFSDIAVGIKVQIANEKRHRFDVAFIPLVSLPTGTDDATSGAADPTFKMAWQRTTGAGFQLGGEVGVFAASRTIADRATGWPPDAEAAYLIGLAGGGGGPA